MNMAPIFVEPLQNLTIIPDKLTTFIYYSPEVIDIEDDEIKIKVSIEKAKS